jgi:adenylate kinase
MNMQLAILGPPGSGKTTVGKSIAEKFDIPYISSGDVARQLADQDPTTALQLKTGAMAPEESMRVLIKQRLDAATAESGGFVLEGFPRTLAQYLAIRIWSHMPIFFHLDVSMGLCLERLIQRAREDDTPDAIARRVNTFQTETQPLIRLLQNSAMVHDIYAYGGVEETLLIMNNVIATYL